VQNQSKVIFSNFYDEYSRYIDKYSEFRQRDTNTYRILKRIIDLIVCLAVLPLAIILIIIFSIIIRLETPGRAFFTQIRVGYKGRYFKLYKLRSMHQYAEKNGPVWAQKNDPRVTKVGKFIRVTRIDELPQLFNVIKGDMSIVGPRPERPSLTAEFEEQYPGFVKRLNVKPGLTGWAQINGGYDITPYEKLKLDLYYMKNKSIKLDFKIMLRTVKVLLTGDGAR